MIAPVNVRFLPSGNDMGMPIISLRYKKKKTIQDFLSLLYSLT